MLFQIIVLAFICHASTRASCPFAEGGGGCPWARKGAGPGHGHGSRGAGCPFAEEGAAAGCPYARKFAGLGENHYSKAQIAKPAPSWEGTAVVDGKFSQLKLSDFSGQYLVFFFYPLDFTFVCPTEIIAFSDRIKEFEDVNTRVVACSVDSQFTHLAWLNTPRKEGGLGKINIPLLSDLTHSIAKDYGVYLENAGHTLRGLFIIDPKGVLRQVTMNDLPVGRSVDETLRLVQAFQFADQHGEVCPAEWKPGQATIIPDPEQKMKYFNDQNP